jgi:hypothetical protein
MITFTIIFNLFITIINIYLALKIWKVRQVLVQVTDALQKSEVNARVLCRLTPRLLVRQQKNLAYCRERYQTLELQIEQIRKILILLIWLFKVWQRQTKLLPTSPLK